MMLQNEKKFKCPCHGSQYNREGKVVRGPAPLVGFLSGVQPAVSTELDCLLPFVSTLSLRLASALHCALLYYVMS